jgi:hypothetical protein
MPSAVPRRKRSTTKKPPPTLKFVDFTWRPVDGDWRTESLLVTGYNTHSGVITFFLNKKIMRSHAPGYWVDVFVKDEVPAVPDAPADD